MLIVETIAKFRLAYFSRKMTIKAICRDFRVSRKVVRKVIRSQATEFRYERDVQPQPKIGPWRDRLDLLLLENGGKPARERLTLIRVFEELRGRRWPCATPPHGLERCRRPAGEAAPCGRGQAGGDRLARLTPSRSSGLLTSRIVLTATRV